MSINGIPVKPEPQIVYGRIASVELVEGEYGQQVEVRLDPVPESDFQRRWWFTPSSRASSKWMRFVLSFNKVRGEDIKSPADLVGAYVKIEEIEKSGNIRGEERTWVEPIVTKVFESEDEVLVEIADAEADYPPFAEEDESPESDTVNDPAVIKLLKQLYEQQGKDAFIETVKGMGYNPEAALQAVGA